MLLSFVIPVRTVNESNTYGHWRYRQKRAKQQRNLTKLLAANASDIEPTQLPFPLTVVLTRISVGTLDDDGVCSALKSVRDGMADWLGVDDKHRHIVRYQYEQEKGKRGQYAVRVEVFAREAVAV